MLLQDDSGTRAIHTMRWGLVPAFTKKEAKPGIVLDLLRKSLSVFALKSDPYLCGHRPLENVQRAVSQNRTHSFSKQVSMLSCCSSGVFLELSPPLMDTRG